MKRYLTPTIREITISPVEFTPATAQEHASCLAKKAAGKLLKPKTRKSKFVDPSQRDEVASKLVGFVIKRIQFPRNGEPFTLSPTDKADATQAGLTACVESGFFRHGIAGLPVIRAIRNAIQGRTCLRMRCNREIGTGDIALVAAEIGHSTEFEIYGNRLTRSQVDMSREVMRVLRTSKACDPSREKSGMFKTQRNFFLLIMDSLTGKTHKADAIGNLRRVCNPNALAKRKEHFIGYLSKAEKFLRATRQPANLGAEIMAAIEKHHLATLA
jgi:hypothetical protein